MNFGRSLLCGVLFLIPATAVFAGDVASHAPIGVMGDHTHKKNEWMVSYRYERMDMSDLYNGSKEVSVDQVQSAYMISPDSMTMEMHMLGLMYGVTDEATAMLMVPYVIKDMEHQRRDGRSFGTHTQGIGDVKLSGLLRPISEWPAHLNLGVSFPTGSINQKDRTLMGPDRDLPYPMQLGSGTVDFLPGITYMDKLEEWSWGFQSMNTMRFGHNDLKYRLGNRHELTSWVAYTWSDSLSTSGRLKYSKWGNVDGADQRLNPAMVPTADAGRQGGERIDLLLGVNFMSHKGLLKHHRIALEFGIPVYQHLDGPQLGVGYHGTVGWQLAF